MTKQPTKKTAAKKSSPKTTAKSASTRAKAKPQAETPQLTLPAPENVVRQELIGYIDFVMVDPQARLPEAAREALFGELKKHYALCVVQCEGYVFNLTGVPTMTLVDAKGNVTRSFGKLDKGQTAKD